MSNRRICKFIHSTFQSHRKLFFVRKMCALRIEALARDRAIIARKRARWLQQCQPAEKLPLTCCCVPMFIIHPSNHVPKNCKSQTGFIIEYWMQNVSVTGESRLNMEVINQFATNIQSMNTC